MTTSENPTEFYDRFVDDYHLLFADWDETLKNQGRTLSTFFQKHISDSKGLSILDCSSGIGAQAIGLALQGYTVTGTDISPKQIERAKRDAARLEAKVSFHVADFTRLDEALNEKFDIVLSFDNAISHLKDFHELQKAFISMKKQLKPNGTLLFSVRNYDELRVQKPCGTLPRTVKDQFGKRIIVQTWDWNTSGDMYNLTLFILQNEGVNWITQSHGPVAMRAFNQSEINETLNLIGCRNVRWFSTKDSGYYQPVVMAKFKVD
jgi:glycine/sarcosine N-methyltransferase